MNSPPKNPEHEENSILLVESDVLARTAIAAYLRHCGYLVIEATTADEAVQLFTSSKLMVDIAFSAVELNGTMDGFGFSKWLRENCPNIRVILAATMEKAAHTAGDLCEEGPHLKKPYEPQQVVEWIKRLRNTKS